MGAYCEAETLTRGSGKFCVCRQVHASTFTGKIKRGHIKIEIRIRGRAVKALHHDYIKRVYQTECQYWCVCLQQHHGRNGDRGDGKQAHTIADSGIRGQCRCRGDSGHG